MSGRAADTYRYARHLVALRRLRDAAFDGIFGEPAWDILLDLYLAAAIGKRVSVSSLCIAAAVPPTTGLRWISALVARDMLVRYPDPQDARRAYIGLTATTRQALDRLLARGAALLAGEIASND